MGQELYLPPENSSCPACWVKGFGVSLKVPPSLTPRESCGMGSQNPQPHMRFCFTQSTAAHPQMNVSTLAQTFSLCICGVGVV